ncbi:MAG TPA: TldD/PmbA family protein, partial [Actinobacteria bacterium]|nr:TldD/PmbA family protein [Actinomycetota bacterium]
RFEDLDGTAAGAAAAAKACRAANATDLDPGRYEVVLEPNAVATIFTFLGVYGFNGKAVLEGRSFVQVGERQFDPAIDMWDDAGDPRAIGVPFDAEGTPKRLIPFIVGGITRGVALNRRLAVQMDSESTGHAVPGGDSVGALPVNLFVGPGAISPEAMIETVGRGLLVTEFNYCRILDPKTQVVTGLTRNGTFLIEHGEIVRPVSNLRFTQSFVEAIAPGRVLAVGSDARFGMGEFGPGMVHGPSLRLAEWNFTGGAKG